MTAKPQAAPTPVRLPDELKKQLQLAATQNDRSLNGEIVSRLRSTISRAVPDKTSNSGVTLS